MTRAWVRRAELLLTPLDAPLDFERARSSMVPGNLELIDYKINYPRERLAEQE
jgi:hypothetical protein